MYLVADGTAFKIGICASGSDGLRQHRRWGWRLCWLLDTPTGDAAWNVEQSITRWWRDELHAAPAYARVDMPQQGFTETVACSSVDARAIRDSAHSVLSCEASASEFN